MTPTLLALSRAYLALPGAAVPISRDTPHPGWRDGIYRDYDGCLWHLIQTCDPDTGKWDVGWWALDFRDAATGGVMLERFAPVAEPIIDCDSRTGYALRVFGRRFDPESGRATLAEAVARAAVALGRAS